MKRNGRVLKIRGWDVALTLACIAAAVGIIVWRREVTAGVFEGILLCGRVVIPSLFPFMFLADFMGRSRASRWLGRVPSAVILSFVSGYPVSAVQVDRLYSDGVVSRRDAVRLMRFCINPGPAFCISAVGGMLLGSTKAGVIIWASVVLASATVGLLSPIAVSPQKVSDNRGGGVVQSFCESCNFAATSMVTICGYTLLFSAFLAVVGGDVLRPVIPLVEITTGLSALGRFPLPFYAACISFGGLAVQFQVLHFGRRLGLRFAAVLLWRVACAILSAAYCGLLLCIFPVQLSEIPAISAQLVTGRGSVAASFCLFFSVLVFLGYVGGVMSRKNQII